MSKGVYKKIWALKWDMAKKMVENHISRLSKVVF